MDLVAYRQRVPWPSGSPVLSRVLEGLLSRGCCDSAGDSGSGGGCSAFRAGCGWRNWRGKCCASVGCNEVAARVIFSACPLCLFPLDTASPNGGDAGRDGEAGRRNRVGALEAAAEESRDFGLDGATRDG